MRDQLQPTPRTRPVGRYAPSPTGQLHLGNLRTALLAWRHCRQMGGLFILRVEDIDGPRTVPGAEEQMLDDLRWLGIDWDEGPGVGGPCGPYRQSERGEIYQAALARLGELGLTYPCICSRKDLREASAPHGAEGPIYPGTCRGLDPACLPAHPNGAAIRFRVDRTAPIAFLDELAGPQHFDLAQMSGDFVVRRRDGLWAYQLACAVDDALMGVTHVVRGADLISSAPRQQALIQALGWQPPAWAHVGLVADAQGLRMAKRDGSCGLDVLREAGLTPAQARQHLLSLPLLES